MKLDFEGFAIWAVVAAGGWFLYKYVFEPAKKKKQQANYTYRF